MKLRILYLIFWLMTTFNLSSQTSKTFVKSYSMPGWEEPTGVLELEDGWLIAGCTSDNLQIKDVIPQFGFLTKIDLSGNIVWKKIYGDTFNYKGFYTSLISTTPNCLLNRHNGNIVVIGYDKSNGFANIFVTEINPENGEQLWTYKDTFNDVIGPSAVCEDDNENLYVLGMRNYFNKVGYPCLYKIDKTGKNIWKKHYSEYKFSSYLAGIIVNKNSPYICLSIGGETKDSVVLLKINNQNGSKTNENVILSKSTINQANFGRSYINQICKSNNSYNLILIDPPYSSNTSIIYRKDLQLFLDSNLRITKLKYFEKNDSMINDFYGEGYIYYDPIDISIKVFVDKNGVLMARAKTPGFQTDDTTIIYNSQSKHGGLYYLGYTYVGGRDEFDCNYRTNCTDILFIKTDSLGRYNKGLDTPKMIKNSVLLYPNPSKNILSVAFNFDKSSTVQLDIFNNLGQKVLQISDHQVYKGFSEIELNISNLSSGIYFCKVSSIVYNGVLKILKE